MSDAIRILLLADSHLGFDLPVRPRVERRRRGHDFLANYARALAPAMAGEVDLVVHAGDVFDRSTVAATLAYQAFEPLRRVADLGIPVFVVPGNHERSRLPHLRFARHPDIHVFANPRTVVIGVRGMRVALSGFPYEHEVRGRVAQLLAKTQWQDHEADVRLLCVHHCFEGATVGPSDYTFTTAEDVVRTADIPAAFVAVLSGHIHRHQVLAKNLSGRPLATPVLYPGSIERTAFAEIGETKGYMVLHVASSDRVPRLRWDFRELPTRPMLRWDLDAQRLTPAGFAAAVEQIMTEAPNDAVLSIRVSGGLGEEHWGAVSAYRLRALRPFMNVEVVPAEGFNERPRRPLPSTLLAAPPQLSLPLFRGAAEP
jgi:DNA repair protein SbcD/Mre11